MKISVRLHDPCRLVYRLLTFSRCESYFSLDESGYLSDEFNIFTQGIGYVFLQTALKTFEYCLFAHENFRVSFACRHPVGHVVSICEIIRSGSQPLKCFT